jgi:hypothetical protein
MFTLVQALTLGAPLKAHGARDVESTRGRKWVQYGVDSERGITTGRHVTNGARDDKSLIFKVAANSMSLSGSSFGVRIDFPRARESGRSKASKRWPP